MNRCAFATSLVALGLVFVACGSDADSANADLVGPRFEPNSPHMFLDVIEAELEAEEEVALCMKQQGFDYAGPQYVQELERLPKLIADFDDAEKFAAEFGYGITNPDVVGPRPGDVMMPIDLDHETALYGRPVHEMASDGLPPAGCWGSANQGGTIHGLGQFFEERERVTSEVDRDGEVEALRAEWSRCMAEQGYSYYAPNEAIENFRDAFTGIMMSSGPGSPLDVADFEALLADEIATAVADQVTCDGAALREVRVSVANRIGGWSPETLEALAELAD